MSIIHNLEMLINVFLDCHVIMQKPVQRVFLLNKVYYKEKGF